jgi:hypothetical protein
MRPITSTLGLILLLTTLFCGGCIGGGIVGSQLSRDRAANARYVPLPHHVAKSPDAVAFRFAMVHDVVHERFPKHGPAFYEERNRRAQARLATLSPDSPEAWVLVDDLGAGLDRLGKPAEAVPILRDKLTRQVHNGVSPRGMYTSYANLGTFLIHANMKAAIAGDAEARAKVEEGRDLIRRSTEVNADAHFGREEWQLVAVESFLAFGQKPDLLREYDLIGDRLDRTVNPHVTRVDAYWFDDRQFDGRPYRPDYSEHLRWGRLDRTNLPDPLSAEQRDELRKYILTVGREDTEGKHTGRFGKAAPFDEPCLGIIGMWRQGGGANPHFALCLGEIMLRVGQRFLAWECYERASRLAGRFWATPDQQEFLRQHCTKRQRAIEETLSAAEVEQLRARFDAELAKGEQYQADYQAYEAAKIATGADIDDPKLFDEFHVGREPIASKPGPEEWYAGERDGSITTQAIRNFWTWGLSSGGAVVFVAGLMIARSDRRRVTLHLRKLSEPIPPPSPDP